MRNAAARVLRTLTALAAVMFVAWSSRGLPGHSLTSLRGTVMVRAADDRRIVVAIDTAGSDPHDGATAEHLFLYTSTIPVELPNNLDSGPGEVRFDGEHFQVILGDGKLALDFVKSPDIPFAPTPGKVIRFDHALGLSHYLGKRWLFRDLTQMHHSSDCERRCYMVGPFALLFPG